MGQVYLSSLLLMTTQTTSEGYFMFCPLGSPSAVGLSPSCTVAHMPIFCSQPRCSNSLRVDVAAADSACTSQFSPALPPASSTLTLRNVFASAHHLNHFPKAIFLFRVSWALIGVYRSVCTLFPSMNVFPSFGTLDHFDFEL